MLRLDAPQDRPIDWLMLRLAANRSPFASIHVCILTVAIPQPSQYVHRALHGAGSSQAVHCEPAAVISPFAVSHIARRRQIRRANIRGANEFSAG